MKRISLVLFTLLIVSGVQAQTTGSPPWQIYTIKGEDFSVALPILPALHTHEEFLESIQQSRKIHHLAAYADGVVYVLSVFENPGQQSLDSFIKARGADATTSARYREVMVDGFRGKVSESGGRLFFATKDRLYEVSAVGAPTDDSRMTRFFSSVSLRKKTGSVEVTDGPGLPWEPPVETGPSNEETTKKVYTGRDVNTKIRLGFKPEPAYTEEARQNQIVGTVILKCVFARNGSVTDFRIVSGLPYGLTDRSLDAAKKIKFIPAMKNGKFVSVWMQLEYHFDLY